MRVRLCVCVLLPMSGQPRQKLRMNDKTRRGAQTSHGYAEKSVGSRFPSPLWFSEQVLKGNIKHGVSTAPRALNLELHVCMQVLMTRSLFFFLSFFSSSPPVFSPRLRPPTVRPPCDARSAVTPVSGCAARFSPASII